MTEDYLRKGRNYEVLIRRAHNCDKGKKHGANSELMIDLLLLEQQDKESNLYRRRFETVKRNIDKALRKLKMRKRYLNSDNEFFPIQLKLNDVHNGDGLAKIASLGLAKVVACENRLRKVS